MINFVVVGFQNILLNAVKIKRNAKKNHIGVLLSVKNVNPIVKTWSENNQIFKPINLFEIFLSQNKF